jgi:hypothetical protein
MPVITIPTDITLTYDNDNVLFTFPVPLMNDMPVTDYYYIIYDLTGLIPPTKTPKNPITYDITNGIKENTSYIFRVRAFDYAGNKSALSSAIAITTLDAPESESVVIPTQTLEPVAPLPAPAPTPVTVVMESDPLLANQVIYNIPGYDTSVIVEPEMTLLRFAEEPEPIRRPAVQSSTHIEYKNNAQLAYGYQGRNKYDFDTMLKIRMAKAQRSLK